MTRPRGARAGEAERAPATELARRLARLGAPLHDLGLPPDHEP
jgi:hypothetical protein